VSSALATLRTMRITGAASRVAVMKPRAVNLQLATRCWDAAVV